MKETRLSVQSKSESEEDQPAAAVPDVYLRSERAPSPRTLIDILRATTSRFPDATAIDDGSVSVTYRELLEDIDEDAEKLESIAKGLKNALTLISKVGPPLSRVTPA